MPDDPRIAKDFDRGDIVKARGSASRFDDRLQMKIDQLRKAQPAKWTSPTCCPPPPTTLPRCGASFRVLSTASPTPTSSCCSPPCWPTGLAQAYREAPAAKQLHHAWLGGLLEHVVSLLTLADRVAPHYPLLDRDLLLTGVILHDIGKMRELSWEIGFEYTARRHAAGPHPDRHGAGRAAPSTACPTSRRS